MLLYNIFNAFFYAFISAINYTSYITRSYLYCSRLFINYTSYSSLLI